MRQTQSFGIDLGLLPFPTASALRQGQERPGVVDVDSTLHELFGWKEWKDRKGRVADERVPLPATLFRGAVGGEH